MKELKLTATVESLDEVLAFIDTELESVDCPMKVQMQLDIAVEEIFVNIANYAYAPGTGSVRILTDITGDSPVISITFIDSGVPYDPLKKEDPDITLSAEEREIGGLGIFMVKKSMDDVRYEYRDGRNMLTLIKSLG